MKKYFILLTAISLSGLLGCRPNLVVRPPVKIDFAAKTIEVEVANVGRGNAGPHLTYIEINQVDAPASAKPQSQYSATVSGINAGGSWKSGVIPFSKFSSRSGLNLNTLTTANVVVRADAKNEVKETNEADNIYDANH